MIYVSDPHTRGDQLSVNPFTGAGTPIGDIGFHGFYGLSFANGGLIGLTSGGNVIQIDYLTGAGTTLIQTGLLFWGGS